MKLNILKIAHHRNGICGAPFHAVIFDEGGSRKLGIVFGMHGHCAVFEMEKLAAGDIAFGSNSWRGDAYEPPLRDAINTLENLFFNNR